MTTPAGPFPSYPGPPPPPHQGPLPPPHQGPPQQPHPGGPPSPPQQPYGPPPVPPHRSYTRPILIGIAVFAVVLVVLGLCGAGAWYGFRKVFFPELRELDPVSAGPIYRKLPEACAVVTDATLKKLVPDAEEMASVHETANPEKYRDPYTSCHWNESFEEGQRLKLDRTLRISMTGYLDNAQPGGEYAKQELDRLRSVAQERAGQTEEKTKYGEFEELTGLGTEAFALDMVTTSPEYSYGGTTIQLRLDNVLIEVIYDGTDDPYGRGVPMDPAESRQGAETVAREIVEALTACPDCRS